MAEEARGREAGGLLAADHVPQGDLRANGAQAASVLPSGEKRRPSSCLSWVVAWSRPLPAASQTVSRSSPPQTAYNRPSGDTAARQDAEVPRAFRQEHRLDRRGVAGRHRPISAAASTLPSSGQRARAVTCCGRPARRPDRAKLAAGRVVEDMDRAVAAAEKKIFTVRTIGDGGGAAVSRRLDLADRLAVGGVPEADGAVLAGGNERLAVGRPGQGVAGVAQAARAEASDGAGRQQVAGGVGPHGGARGQGQECGQSGGGKVERRAHGRGTGVRGGRKRANRHFIRRTAAPAITGNPRSTRARGMCAPGRPVRPQGRHGARRGSSALPRASNGPNRRDENRLRRRFVGSRRTRIQKERRHRSPRGWRPRDAGQCTTGGAVRAGQKGSGNVCRCGPMGGGSCRGFRAFLVRELGPGNARSRNADGIPEWANAPPRPDFSGCPCGPPVNPIPFVPDSVRRSPQPTPSGRPARCWPAARDAPRDRNRRPSHGAAQEVHKAPPSL